MPFAPWESDLDRFCVGHAAIFLPTLQVEHCLSQNEVNARPTVGRFAITVVLNEWQLDRNRRPLLASPQAALSV